MTDQTPTNTLEQRDAVMEPWWRQANAEGWEVDADPLYWAAVDGIAWNLLEQTMDTADREPSATDLQDARATAERILAAREAHTNTVRAAVEGGCRAVEDWTRHGGDQGALIIRLHGSLLRARAALDAAPVLRAALSPATTNEEGDG